MYLALVAVAASEAVLISPERLHEALAASTADVDGLRHAYVETGESMITFSLYLQASDGDAALRLADELCRRTIASVLEPQRWQVTSTRLAF